MLNNINHIHNIYHEKLRIKFSYIQYENLILNFNEKILFSHQYKYIITCLGPIFSYSHLATIFYAQNILQNRNVLYMFCNNFINVLSALKKKIVHFAILPISNNCSGTIQEVSTVLHKYDVDICYNFPYHIQHCLISNLKNNPINNINTIMSHQQPILQCSQYIHLFPKWQIKFCASSTYALKYITYYQKKNNIAAISNKIAAHYYNLYVIKHNISNKKKNITNFIVLTL
ncbi:prephenate dehydratase domain-containing protein [Enterobacteriaceae endosymbiont of Macroplea appendiculata]|uniref:prephenate dehydratase domain-containing protein n=1 Tax=Enterobacteriaceae endosymbiont of Macroplea appendiculata TaxID=2675790 RepID=UPI001449C8BC|nr:prephenate dehydratase domain-containing protein [Enterobacteriaceae endosymbiont of Macroplea appendiculata]QJC31052.1 hypothetical protein GJT86_02265 [Enterobacteriaceae endosymbiont of Macroplea appendiculata]